jgi:predicted protein tyrosine phosphatase
VFGETASSAGLDPAATRVVDDAAIAAADMIFVMERHHRDKLQALGLVRANVA